MSFKIFFGNPATVSGQTIALAQLTESESLTAIKWSPKIRMLARLAETEAGVALVKQKRKAIAQVSEAESTFAMSKRKARTLAQLAESHSSTALGKAKVKAIARLAESDGVVAIGRVKGRALAQLAESESMFALSKAKIRVLGMLSEIETWTGSGKAKQRVLAHLQETELLYTIELEGGGGPPVLVDILQLSEQDSLFALTVVKSKLLGMLTESESAQGVGRQKVKALEQLAETESLTNVVWSPKIRMLGMLVEVDQARRVSPPPPDERTYFIYWQGRVFVVSPTETRLLDREPRESTMVIAHEDRVMEVLHD